VCQGKLGTRWCLFGDHFSGDSEDFGVEGARGRFQRFAKARQAFWRLTGAHQFLPPLQREENAGSIQLRFQPERKGFFIEGFVPDLVAPAGNSFFISRLRINLPDPPGIPVTGGSKKILGRSSRNKNFFDPTLAGSKPQFNVTFEKISS